jgi:light-regulated signal transduction histidine kinase (bacteriophytochrome)
MKSFYAPALLMAGLGFSGLLMAFLLVLTGHAHRIEREVERRTKQVASVNRALQFSNSRLKVSNDDLEEFARVVSHDLREPLRTIAGFSQLLTRQYGEKLDERGTEWLQHTVDGVLHLERLFDALHSYAQVGARSDEWNTVDLRSCSNPCARTSRTPSNRRAERWRPARSRP